MPGVGAGRLAEDAAREPGLGDVRGPPGRRARPGGAARKIRATTEDLKEREQAVGAAFLVDLTQFAAPTLLGLAARVAHRQPFFNVVITSVPGRRCRCTRWARMLEAYPVVPLTRNLALGIAILSYCGRLHFGLYVDADAVADVAGVRRPRRGRVRGVTKIA